MAYLNITTNSAVTSLTFRKHYTDAAQASAADDRIQFILPNGNYLNLNEANAADSALYIAGGIVFSTTNTDVAVISNANLTAGFPDDSNTSLFASYTSNEPVAGSAISMTEGLLIYNYNNQTGGATWTGVLFIPTIMGKIADLAQDLIDCQCNCELNEAKAQKYIKARAYLDLLISKVNAATTAETLIALQPMVTTLTNFLNGTEELCGSC